MVTAALDVRFGQRYVEHAQRLLSGGNFPPRGFEAREIRDFGCWNAVAYFVDFGGSLAQAGQHAAEPRLPSFRNSAMRFRPDREATSRRHVVELQAVVRCGAKWSSIASSSWICWTSRERSRQRMTCAASSDRRNRAVFAGPRDLGQVTNPAPRQGRRQR
jgi:hypothetical protein